MRVDKIPDHVRILWIDPLGLLKHRERFRPPPLPARDRGDDQADVAVVRQKLRRAPQRF